MKSQNKYNSISARVCRDDKGKDCFLLNDSIKNKRLRLTPKVFEVLVKSLNQNDSKLLSIEEEAMKILREELLSCNDFGLKKSEDIRVWCARGWKRSLEYFYSSRINGYSDGFIEFRDIQSLAVRDYSEQSPIPLPTRNPSNLISLAIKTKPKLKELGQVFLNRKCSERPKKGRADFQLLSTVLNLSTLKFKETWSPPVDDSIKIYQSLGSCFDFYVVSYNTKELNDGVYKYHPDISSIEKTTLEISREEMYKTLIGHDAPLSSSFSILLVANFDRAMWRYRHDRALRNIYIEAGRICQYFLLNLTAYGLNTHITPAAIDELATKLLEIDKSKQQLMYSITAG